MGQLVGGHPDRSGRTLGGFGNLGRREGVDEDAEKPHRRQEKGPEQPLRKPHASGGRECGAADYHAPSP